MENIIMEYSTLTDQMNELLNSQDDWTNIPGNLSKIIETTAGYAWGIGQNKLFKCALPCKGNWVSQDFDGTILDIAADDFLYVLYTSNGTFLKIYNNTEWITIPFKEEDTLKNIYVTSSYIWGQGTQKWKLPKPGTTGNWMLVPDTSNTQITSSSLNALYGIDSTGKAWKTDETLKSGWSLLPQFKGMLTGLIGTKDPNLYGMTSTDIEKCIGQSCTNIQADEPTNISITPSNTIWLTSNKSGDLGNIYTKSDIPPIDQIQTLDLERDTIVKKTEIDYMNSTYIQMFYKQIEEIRKLLLNETPKKLNTDELKEIQNRNTLLTKNLYYLYISIGCLILIILNYIFLSSLLGETSHSISILLLIGYFFLIYFINNGSM